VIFNGEIWHKFTLCDTITFWIWIFSILYTFITGYGIKRRVYCLQRTHGVFNIMKRIKGRHKIHVFHFYSLNILHNVLMSTYILCLHIELPLLFSVDLFFMYLIIDLPFLLGSQKVYIAKKCSYIKIL
jgi:hypothetical protein